MLLDSIVIFEKFHIPLPPFQLHAAFGGVRNKFPLLFCCK